MQDRYREIYEAFRWEVPEHFNMGVACCRRWAEKGGQINISRAKC